MRKIFIFLVFGTSISTAQTTHIINPSSGGSGSSIPSNVVYLSKAGIVSDASINLYDSSFGSDQTSAIQAILNTSSATNPLTIFVDVKASCTGLKVKSNTTINIMPTCGFILRDHSDNSLLSNYNWTANSNSIVDSNITINGMNGGILNGNGWRSDSNYQANNTTAKGQITVINFFGVKNVNLINTTFLNASSWCIMFATSQNVKIDNCIIDDGTGHYIQDGIDFLGMAKGVTITNCTITNGDDKIVFCPNSTGGVVTYGTGLFIDHSVYTGVDGDQTDIRIDHIVFKGTGKGFAFYVQGGNKVSDVHVSNISGTCQSTWLDMENYLTGYTITSGSQICHNLTFENIGVEVTSYVGYGDVEFPLANIMCSVDNLVFRNVSRISYAQNAPSFKIKTATSAPAVTISNLTIDGFYTVNTNPANFPAPGSIAIENATVNRLSILNAYCDFGTVATWIDRPLLNINSTSKVHNLFLQNINFRPLKSVVGIQGTVDYLAMNNVIHTDNADSTPTLNITGTLRRAVISNYIGKLLYTGTIDTLITAAVGTIFDKGFTGADYARTGSSGTWNYSSDSLFISGTGTSNPTDYVEYANWYTSLEKATSSVSFIPTGDGNGIGIGLVGYYTGGTAAYIAKVVLTGSTKGQLIYQKVLGSTSSPTNLATSGTTYFPITNGTPYTLSLTRTPDTITVTIAGNDGQSQSIKYAQLYTEAGFNGEKAGRIGVVWYGGNQTVYNIHYSTPIARYPKLLCAGDSYMQGAYAGTNADRYTQKLMAYYQDRIEVDAGASNTSADLVKLLPEMLLISPMSVFVNIGRNTPLTQADLDTLRDNFTRNGIKVFLGTVFPATTGLYANNSLIRGESGVTLIDFDSTLQNGNAYLDPTYAASDGTHLNTAGNNAVYTKLTSALTGYLAPK